MKKKFYLLFSACLLKLIPAFAAAFTPGNVVVLRVGTGTGALSSASTAMFLDEYSPGGTLVQSIAMPTSGAGVALSMSGSATSEGQISRSPNGQYLAIPGYNAAPGVAAIAGTTAAADPRGYAIVDYTGSVVTEGFSATFASGNNVRGAYATNSGNAYVAGASNGIAYFTGSTFTQLSTTVTNLRTVNVAEIGSGVAQLFVSASSGAFRLATVGTGLPTTSGQTITTLPGAPTSGSSSPYQVFFADVNPAVAGVDEMYVADDGAGIIKYSLVSGTWTATGTVGVAADMYRGLTGVVNGTSVTLYAISGASTSKLVTITDNSGYNGTFSGTVTPVVTAGTNKAFRSVALAPFNSSASNTFVGNLSANYNLALNYGSGTAPSTTGDATIVAAGPASVPVLTGTGNAVQNLTIGSGATFTVPTSTTLNVTGTISNSGTLTTNGTVQLSGSGAQTISSGTFSSNTVSNLVVNNAAGITVNTPLTVSNTLTLTSGIVNNSTNAITVSNTSPSAISGGSSTAYVAGTLTRIHDATAGDSYFYPIGSSSRFRPIRLVNSATVSGSNSFAATYFSSAYSNTTATNPSYTVSNVEYWDIARQSGSSAMNVSLITDDNSVSAVTASSTVEVGHFNGTTWDNLGNNGGNTTFGASGSEIMTTSVSNFSPFTFITNTGTPLPVSLSAFSLKEMSNTATQLMWTIPQAANVATVTIERSEDGRSFQAIGGVSGEQVYNGNYTDAALPTAGTLYYRLKMVNPAGEAIYSNTLVAMHSTNGTLNVYPNPAGNTATISWHAGTLPVQITLTNAIGQQVYAATPATDVTNTTINVVMLPAGQYIVTWKQGSVTQHSKLSVVR